MNIKEKVRQVLSKRKVTLKDIWDRKAPTSEGSEEYKKPGLKTTHTNWLAHEISKAFESRPDIKVTKSHPHAGGAVIELLIKDPDEGKAGRYIIDIRPKK